MYDGYLPANARPVIKIDRRGRVLEKYESAAEAARKNYICANGIKDRCYRHVVKEWVRGYYTFRYADDPAIGNYKPRASIMAEHCCQRCGKDNTGRGVKLCPECLTEFRKDKGRAMRNAGRRKANEQH